MARDEEFGKLGAASHEVGDEHLGQRHVARYADRAQLFHKQGKRIVLVSEALGQSFMLAPQEIGEYRIAIEACA